MTDEQILDLAKNHKLYLDSGVIALVREAVAAERERCARICDEQAEECFISETEDDQHCHGAAMCAAAIRQPEAGTKEESF